jgi:hypothetical protein
MEEDVRERDGKSTEGDGMSGEEGESMRESVCRQLYLASVYLSSISHAQSLFLPVAPFFPRPLSLSLSPSLSASLYLSPALAFFPHHALLLLPLPILNRVRLVSSSPFSSSQLIPSPYLSASDRFLRIHLCTIIVYSYISV